MPALSFQEEWLDALLRGGKKQTTRPQTTMIKVGAVCTLYNQQRRRITDKPLRRLSDRGKVEMTNRIFSEKYDYPPSLTGYDYWNYYAHLLGKVKVTNVYVIYPHEIESRMNHVWAWEHWAVQDGFTTLDDAGEWFRSKYGEDWMDHNWTVIQWDDWLERYFLPEPEAI